MNHFVSQAAAYAAPRGAGNPPPFQSGSNPTAGPAETGRTVALEYTQAEAGPTLQRTVQRTIHNHLPPVYGPIVGCCGRVPEVHYFREGQQCCPDGTRIDGSQSCA